VSRLLQSFAARSFANPHAAVNGRRTLIMDAQHSIFSPSTCFTVACVAFAVSSVWTVWRGNPAPEKVEAREARPRPRRRVAVDSIYADTSSSSNGEPDSPLTVLAELISSCAKLSDRLRKSGTDYVVTALLTELSLITASLCQLQAAACNNSGAIAPGTGPGACFTASASSLQATIRFLAGSEERKEGLEQLRAQKPALEFLLSTLNTPGLPPTPPMDHDPHQMLKTSNTDILSTGMTPAMESRDWMEPPPEYSPPSSSSTVVLAEKAKEKTDVVEESSSQPQVENAGGDANVEALYQAVTDDDAQVLSDLLEAGLSANEGFGELQRTPLHQAAHLNFCTCLSILLRHGADMSAEDTKGDTPLHLAAWAGNVEALASLLSHGADVDWLSGRDGYSPLWCAISANHIDAARLLLSKYGARVSLRSGSGLMPLHQAAVTGQSAMCELLLDRGAQVDAKDDDQNTALHYAAASGSKSSVRILLQAGAAVAAQQAQGLTALHWAAHKGHVDALALLLDHMAPLNAGAEEGATPLHMAANRGHLAAVRILLERGCKRKVFAVWDGVEGTAAEMARAKNHARVARTIQSWSTS
jgi:ankyrin repeat protein